MPNLISIKFLIPELILSAASLIILFCGILTGGKKKIAAPFAIVSIIISAFFSVSQWSLGNPPLFYGMMILDRSAIFFKVIFALTAVGIILFSERSKEVEESGDRFEYYSLILGSLVGMSFLSMSINILPIYLSLEFVSLISYLLVGFVKGSMRSSEAAIKYVLYGAVASGVFLFGASLFYGATGSLYIANVTGGSLLLQVSGAMMLAGFLYKIAAFPMHAWCPDAYEGAPITITSFLSVAPKAAGFAVLLRVLHIAGVNFNWQIILCIVSALTMTFGNLAAIPQTNVKRLLAYSSIAHAGYILMGLASFSAKGDEAVYFYFIAYLLMNLGAFLLVQIIGDKFGGETIDKFSGLVRKGPFGVIISILMTIFLLSLTGVPPFIGFIGKFYIFAAVIDAKLYWLAIVGIVNSVISLYYYMRIVKAIFFDKAENESKITSESRLLAVSSVVLGLLVVILGIYWQPLSNVTSSILIGQ